MFGLYRICLALMVAANHLLGLPSIGGYAVFGFYTLSGYLMTLIMHERYGFTGQGRTSFAINRILRIYPTYWVSIIISALIILAVGHDFSTSFHKAMFIPNDVASVFKNIFIFFPGKDLPRLTQPAWALTVELFYYLLICLGLSRKKNIVSLWLGLGIIYHIVVWVLGLDWSYRYFTIAAGAMPFAMGALIYHHKAKFIELRNLILRKVNRYTPIFIFSVLLFNWASSILVEWFLASRSGGFSWNYTWGAALYINFLINILMILVLIEPGSQSFFNKKFDKLAGDLSYPLYLLHEPISLGLIFMLGTLGVTASKHSPLNFLVTVPVSLCLSFGVNKLVEKPIETVRNKVKLRLNT